MLEMMCNPVPELISSLSCGDGNQVAVCFQSHIALVWKAQCQTAVQNLSDEEIALKE